MSGIELRDYFAGLAMQMEMQELYRQIRQPGETPDADPVTMIEEGETLQECAARYAYQLADAMLKAKVGQKAVKAARDDKKIIDALLQACETSLRMLREHGHTFDGNVRPKKDCLDAHDTGLSGPLSSVIENAIDKAYNRRPL